MSGNWKVGDGPVTDEHKAELKELLAHEHPISEVEGLETALSARAATSHGHAIADVDGLQGELDDKAHASHTHDDYAVTDHDHDDTYAVIMHTHAISDISGLQTALDGKASTSHTHAGYAAASHTHAIADVSGLQTALDARTTRRFGTATGTTDSNGLFTVTYSPAFASEPIVCMEPPSSGNRKWVKVSGSATGCSFRLEEQGQGSVALLGLVLLAATTNVSGAPARMMVMGQ